MAKITGIHEGMHTFKFYVTNNTDIKFRFDVYHRFSGSWYRNNVENLEPKDIEPHCVHDEVLCVHSWFDGYEDLDFAVQWSEDEWSRTLVDCTGAINYAFVYGRGPIKFTKNTARADVKGPNIVVSLTIEDGPYSNMVK